MFTPYKTLCESDAGLVNALQDRREMFCITDPDLYDNPIGTPPVPVPVPPVPRLVPKTASYSVAVFFVVSVSFKTHAGGLTQRLMTSPRVCVTRTLVPEPSFTL